MSRLVTIDQIADGMELEQAVKNQFGQLLIPANARLKEKHRKVLKTWGVSSVHIREENNNSTDPEISDNQKKEGLKLLCQRFKWSPRNQNEEDLFEMVLSRNFASNKNPGESQL